MGAVYRLARPRNLRLLADQIAGMPGINLTVQLLPDVPNEEGTDDAITGIPAHLA